MAKKIKDKWIGARVDEPYETKVNNYVAASEELTTADLIRDALDEYMLNHPIKDPDQVEIPEHLKIKPGE